jgi:hypothetical protein
MEHLTCQAVVTHPRGKVSRFVPSSGLQTKHWSSESRRRPQRMDGLDGKNNTTDSGGESRIEMMITGSSLWNSNDNLYLKRTHCIGKRMPRPFPSTRPSIRRTVSSSLNSRVGTVSGCLLGAATNCFHGWVRPSLKVSSFLAEPWTVCLADTCREMPLASLCLECQLDSEPAETVG